MTPFEHYLNAVMVRAAREAREDGSSTVEASHLLIAVAAEPEPDPGPGPQGLLAEVGLDEAGVRRALDREFEHSLAAVGVSPNRFDLPRPSRLPAEPGMGTSARLVLERGVFGAARKKDQRPAHLLLGLLSAEVGTVARALALAGVDREDLLARVRAEVGSR